MLQAAITGLGWWGGTLVESMQDSPNMRFSAAFTRSRSAKDQELAAKYGLKLFDNFETMVADPAIGAVVLATPPVGHHRQILTAARHGKHVFCEKPFVMSSAEAEEVIAAVTTAKIALGLGYNRRFHPSWVDLKRRIKAGELGIILHAECTMSGPNGLWLTREAWRARKEDAPCGGLFPMGVHAVDGLIDLFGAIDSVFCQSLRRAIPNDNDDTTSILFRMKEGPTAYLSTMMATAGTFRFQVYGSKAMALLGGNVHVIGQSSHQRRAGLFGSYVIQPVKGDAESIEVADFDVNKAELEAFAAAANGGPAYPIPHAEMMHGVAATEAIIKSARSGMAERVR